jgi:hypothetical protein
MTRAAIACVRVTYGSLRCTLRGRRSGKANDARREPVSQLRFISSNMTGVRAPFKIDGPLFTTGDVRFRSVAEARLISSTFQGHIKIEANGYPEGVLP